MPPEPIYVTRPTLPPLEEYVAELQDIWEARYVTNAGPKHQLLMKQLANYLRVPHVALFANGHLALEGALQTLGITGEVITTPFTFVSTTLAIVRSGATPVCCDIDPTHYVLEPKRIEELITPRTEAILPVHVYGNLCDDRRIGEIARKHGLKVIYDAAHAFGISRDGVPVGDLGDISMFSLHATKVFNSIEGGALTFADETLARPLHSWRQFGHLGGENAEVLGTNAKLTEFAAAMGLCNLRYVDETIAGRRAVTERYRQQLADVAGVTLNPEVSGVEQNYAYFPVLFNPEVFGRSRDEVAATLARHDVYARRYFYPLTSQMSVFAGSYPVEATPIAAGIAEQVLTLPLYADLPLEQVDRICEIILNTR
ncbi:MAG: DegT/DnrJ/EryC1/StrS family aminotransferase [Propionicimonas sp.]|nr:DegT/DnrJ/EryC1/StrS family aminotransferase [Propionicimonas sp.]